MRKRVFISGPISHGNLANNVNAATRAFVVLAEAGLAPFCPHWSVYACDATLSVDRRDGSQRVLCSGSAQPNGLAYDDWMAVDLAWVEIAHAVLRLAGESKGADMETQHAAVHGIPVFWCISDVLRWASR